MQDGLNKEDILSTLKLVTKPIPEVDPGHVVVHITLRPVNPTDLLKLRRGQVADGQGVAGSEGYGIVHKVLKFAELKYPLFLWICRVFVNLSIRKVPTQENYFITCKWLFLDVQTPESRNGMRNPKLI